MGCGYNRMRCRFADGALGDIFGDFSGTEKSHTVCCRIASGEFSGQAVLSRRTMRGRRRGPHCITTRVKTCSFLTIGQFGTVTDNGCVYYFAVGGGGVAELVLLSCPSGKPAWSVRVYELGFFLVASRFKSSKSIAI